MNTITWKIDNLERTLPDGLVVTAHWRCNGTDGANHGTAYGSVTLTGDPAAPGFIPFAELTEAQVVGWVQESLGGGLAVETIVAAQIEAQANPVRAAGLPWN